MVAFLALGLWSRRRAPVISFAALTAAGAYLPTSNLLFPSGIVLAERDLYVPVLAVAVGVGCGVEWLRAHYGSRRASLALMVLVVGLTWRSYARLPSWSDNRSFLLTLLEDHPESYRAHASAAAVLAGLGDTAGARREYARADSLFGRDPHLNAAYAFFLVEIGDPAAAAPLAARARSLLSRERVALRVQFLLALERGERARALALADTARLWFRWDGAWYQKQLQ